jgi:hypothetical protein
MLEGLSVLRVNALRTESRSHTLHASTRRTGAAVRQLGTQVGLAPDLATTALSALVPALAAGFQRNLQSQGGLESLMTALSSGNHASPLSAGLGGSGGGIVSMLTPLLDGNRDGSIVDDVTSMIGGFMRRS